MTQYKNISGDSGVTAYEAGADYIKIQFNDLHIYLYDNNKPGKKHVDEMKRLAAAGSGLATYINTHVRGNYASRIK